MAENLTYRTIESGCKGTIVYVSRDDFLCSKDKDKGITQYLRWVHWREGCEGSAHIVDGVSVKVENHDHVADPRQIRKKEIKQNLKRQGKRPLESSSVIYDNVVLRLMFVSSFWVELGHSKVSFESAQPML